MYLDEVGGMLVLYVVSGRNQPEVPVLEDSGSSAEPVSLQVSNLSFCFINIVLCFEHQSGLRLFGTMVCHNGWLFLNSMQTVHMTQTEVKLQKSV